MKKLIMSLFLGVFMLASSACIKNPFSKEDPC